MLVHEPQQKFWIVDWITNHVQRTSIRNFIMNGYRIADEFYFEFHWVMWWAIQFCHCSRRRWWNAIRKRSLCRTFNDCLMEGWWNVQMLIEIFYHFNESFRLQITVYFWKVSFGRWKALYLLFSIDWQNQTLLLNIYSIPAFNRYWIDKNK